MDRNKQKAHFFRLRVVLSSAFILLGIIPVIVGYFGYKGHINIPYNIPAEMLLLGGGILLFVGALLFLTLLHCPFCGKRIYLTSLPQLYFYTCPYCNHSIDIDKRRDLHIDESCTEYSDSISVSFRRKVLLLYFLLILWVICVFILQFFSMFGSLFGRLIYLSAIPLIIASRMLRCPYCGALVAKQAPIWEFYHFHCNCGFSSDQCENK